MKRLVTLLAVVLLALLIASTQSTFKSKRSKSQISKYSNSFIDKFSKRWGIKTKPNRINPNWWRNYKDDDDEPKRIQSSSRVQSASRKQARRESSSSIRKNAEKDIVIYRDNRNLFAGIDTIGTIVIDRRDDDDWQYVEGRLGNWIVERGQIGFGTIYNGRWKQNLRVIELDSDENQIYRYVLNLQGGLYEINFQWAARQGHPFSTSQFTVNFNGDDISHLIANNYDIQFYKATIEATYGQNVLKLIARGSSDSYGATVANFAIYKSYEDDSVPGFIVNEDDLPITYLPLSNDFTFSTINNYLSNGDFEASRIPTKSQYFYVTSDIPHWTVNNGHLGYAKHFNINFDQQTQIIHLDARGRNINYLNKFNLGRGRFELSFDWSARDGRRFDTSQFQIRFNKKTIKRITPSDYYVHRYSDVVESVEGLNYLELVGAGPVDGFGACIDNIVVRDY